MSSLARLGHVRTTVLLSAMLLLCGGCGETKPQPAAAPAPVVVVEERVEEVASEQAAQKQAAAAPQAEDQESTLVGDEVEAASVPPAARDTAVADRIAELVGVLAAKATDSRTRLMAIDELAAVHADAKTTLEPLLAALADAEPGVRWHATRAIGLLGRDAVLAIPALVKLLGDPDPVVVTQAAAAIGHIRGDDDREPIPEADAALYAATVEPLVETMMHPDPRVRRATVRALRRVSTSRQELASTVRRQLADADPIAVMPALHTLADLGAEAVPFLVESLQDPASRYWAEVVLAEIGPAAAPAVAPLTQLAREGEIAERVQSILSLAEIGPAAAPAGSAIAEALASPDRSLQYVAAFALGKIQASDADEPLREAAGSDDQFLASLASWALATIHPDDATLLAEAATRLRAGLASESPAVRNAAVEGLSDLAPRFDEAKRAELAAAFAELLVDPVPSVGLAAGGGLIRLGPDAVDALRAALAEPLVRGDALEILALLGPQALPALDDLVSSLADADPVCRGDAALALAAIGPEAKGAVPALEQVLGDESAEAPVRYTAAYALGKIGGAAASAEPLLRKLADSDDELLATVAVWAALKINPDDKELFSAAVPKLLRALQDEQELVRLEATVALGEIGRPAAAALPILEMLAEDDPSRQVRGAAEAAVGQIRQ
jgi:HEAT repeat protein